MRRCDDCSSDAIDLSANPVPFGDYYHYVAHVSKSETSFMVAISRKPQN